MAEKRINKFLLSSIWYIIATVVAYSVAFFGNIVFTHLMPQEHYGLYTNYYSIVTLLLPFVGMNLYVGLRNGYFDFRECRNEFRSSLLFLSFLILILTSTVVIFVFLFFSKIFSVSIIVFALLHAYSFFVINFFNVYSTQNNNYKTYSILILLQNLVQFTFPLLFIVLIGRNSYHERVWGSSIPLAVIAAILGTIVLVKGRMLVNKEYYSYALKISVPSLLGTISSFAMKTADNIMITAMVGAESTAVYGFMYNIGNVLIVLITAIEGAIASWIYNAIDSSSTSGARIWQKWYYLFFIACTALLLMIIPEFIKLTVPSSYWEFRYIPPFVAGSSLVTVNVLYEQTLKFYKKTGWISLCVAISAVCNIALNYFFIRRIGAVAAAYTSLFSLFLYTILCRLSLGRIHRNIFSDAASSLFFLAIICLCTCFAIIGEDVVLRCLVYAFVFLAVAVLLFVKRNKIKRLIFSGEK